MNKYSGWNDDQVDKEIAIRKGLNLCDGQHYEPKASYWDNGFCTMFDPCNSWSDAGPLMVDNEISLITNGDEFSATCQSLDIIASFGCEVRNLKNPLRAISECYLLMTDEINES